MSDNMHSNKMPRWPLRSVLHLLWLCGVDVMSLSMSIKSQELPNVAWHGQKQQFLHAGHVEVD